MQFFTPDGTRLAYHRTGTGAPLVCVPGGPLLSADYLGDLGGLSDHAELILLDHRGSGASGTPTDPATYRCDRVADDVEALRLHLGLERLELLGHSAGANVVYRYAERHPDRVDRLVLVTPSTWAVGVEISDEARSEVARPRAYEPWCREAAAALARAQAGTATEADWAAITPFTYGRWDNEVAAYNAAWRQRATTRRCELSRARAPSTRRSRGPRWPSSTSQWWSLPAAWTLATRSAQWWRWPGCFHAVRSSCRMVLATFHG